MGAKNKLTAAEKKNKRLAKWLVGLSKEQKELMTEYCIEQSQSGIVAYFNAYERVLRPALYKITGDEIIGEKAFKSIIFMIGEEGLKLHEYKNGSIDYMKKIEESRNQIINKYEDLREQGKKEKDILEELCVENPKLTKNAIRNVIAEHKRDSRKDEMTSDEAVNFIFNDEDKNIKEDKKMKEVKSEATAENKQFKILKKTVIVDVEGQQGTYHVENGTVSVIGDGSDYSFGNAEAVKAEAEAQKENLRRLINDVDKKTAEILTVMELYK